MVEHEAHFTDEPEPARMSPLSIRPCIVGIIMLYLALFGPVMFLFYQDRTGSHWQIVAMTYSYTNSRVDFYMPHFYDSFQFFMALIPFFFLRIVFAFQMWRFYRSKATKMYTALVGFASEIQYQITLIGMGILGGLFNPHEFQFFIYSLPPYIPILLLSLTGFLIYIVFPTREAIGPWKGLEEKEKWWRKRKSVKQTTTDECIDR